MAGRTQEPVTFEDVAVYVSRAEWDAMAAGQRELYRGVTLDNYELLASLGYPGPKPDILYRMERGEEPWVCTPQSPVRWAGPKSPPPGHAGDASQLERTQHPCQGVRHSGHWRLRSSQLLRKFGEHRVGSQGSVEAASGGAGPVESRDRAQPDTQGASADVTHGGVHLLSERQNKEAEPGETLRRTSPKHLWGSGEAHAEDASETVWKDHCYCAAGPWCRIPGPLWEHNYCWHGGAGTSALRDHGYCHRRRGRARGGTQEAVVLGRKDWVMWQTSQMRRILWRARRRMRYCRACALPVLEPPRAPTGTGSCPECPTPRNDPSEGAPRTFCPHAIQDIELPQPSHCGGAQSGAPEAFCAPVMSFQHPNVEANREAPQLLQEQNGEGHEPSGRGYVPLRTTCRMVLRRVGCGLASRGHAFKLGGCSLCKDVRPMVVQTDS